MWRRVAAALAIAVTTARAQTLEQTRAVVRQARHALEVDSTQALSERWSAALARDSTDRLAALGLANIAWLTAHYDEADGRYRPLAQKNDAVGVYAQIGLAGVLLSKGEPQAADTAYALAAARARAANDSVPLVQSLINWATIRAHSRSPAAAAALLAGANRYIPRGEKGLEADYECTSVSVGAVPRGADPKVILRHGAALAHESGDRYPEAHCWFELGNEYTLLGDMASAIAVYDTLERQVLPATDFQNLARVRQRRSFAEQLYGDYGNALRSAQIAIANGERAHALPVVAYARLTQGAVYLGLGDIRAAISTADSAAQVFAKVGDIFGRLNALSLASDAAIAGADTATARRVDMTEYQIATSIGSANYLADAQGGLASVAMYEQRWDEAGRWIDSMGASIARGRLRGWASSGQFDRGVLALATGHYKEAERQLTEADRARDSSQHRDRYEDAALLAEVHLALGDTARAERELTAAEDALDRWRATLDDREIRVLAFQYNSHVGRPDPGVAKVIAAVAGAGRIGPALELAERRRARDLADRLATSGSTSPWSAAGDVLETVQRALPDDSTAVLEYVTGPGEAPTTLFVITRRSARAYALPPGDSLANDVGRMVAFVENGVNASAPSAALGKALAEQALKDLPASVTRLVVVPDGVLHRVPFGALRVDNDYLVKRYAIALAPSAGVQAWLWAHARPSAAAPVTVLAFGDPRFARETSSEDATLRSAFDETGGLPRLKASADEARLVGRFGGSSVVRLRDSASASYLKHAQLDSFRIIHFATHAVVDDRAATRTALALAPGPGESGFVTSADLAALKLHADLVVLSACRTAGGRIVAGEGVRGLTAPLLAAGAHAVVASYWEIGDRQTVRLVHDFYRAMAEGHPAADALRIAEVAAIERGAPPREWAAFTLSGDPTVRVPVTVPAFDWLWRLLN